MARRRKHEYWGAVGPSGRGASSTLFLSAAFVRLRRRSGSGAAASVARLEIPWRNLQTCEPEMPPHVDHLVAVVEYAQHVETRLDLTVVDLPLDSLVFTIIPSRSHVWSLERYA
jgi:hypothetical protein